MTPEALLRTYALAEGLKREVRHSWLSDGRRESVAEHSWMIGLLALLLHRRLETPVRLDRVLAMALVHDLAEAITGDLPYFAAGDRGAKQAAERAAMLRIAGLLPAADGAMLLDFWEEFEAGTTAESRLLRALDHLEVQAQHNLADLTTWEPVEHDLVYTKMDARSAHEPLLRALCAAIRAQAEVRMAEAGVDVAALRRKHEVVGA
jgi:putative hydrolase of HD superfamily